MAVTDDEAEAWRLNARALDAGNRQTSVMFGIVVMMIVFQTCFLGWLEYDSRWRYSQQVDRVVMSQQVRVEQRNGVHDLTERVLKGEFDGKVRRTDGTDRGTSGGDSR